LQIEYSNSSQDYREALANRRGIATRIFLVLFTGLLGGFLYFGIFYLWRLRRPPIGLQIYFVCVLFVFVYFILLSAPGFERFLCWLLRKPFLRYSPKTLALTEEFLEFSCAGFQRRFEWRELHKLKETRNLIVLEFGKGHQLSVFIPKRVLTVIELEQFRELLNRNIRAQ